jgi:hypothetical protein
LGCGSTNSNKFGLCSPCTNFRGDIYRSVAEGEAAGEDEQRKAQESERQYRQRLDQLFSRRPESGLNPYDDAIARYKYDTAKLKEQRAWTAAQAAAERKFKEKEAALDRASRERAAKLKQEGKKGIIPIAYTSDGKSKFMYISEKIYNNETNLQTVINEIYRIKAAHRGEAAGHDRAGR